MILIPSKTFNLEFRSELHVAFSDLEEFLLTDERFQPRVPKALNLRLLRRRRRSSVEVIIVSIGFFSIGFFFYGYMT